jgi:hypothetical protein
MKRFTAAAIVLALIAMAGIAVAKDQPDPTGTWKWTINAGGQSREATLRLKLQGDKLTGAVLGRDGKEIAIEDASYKDGEVSFNVTREREGQKFKMKYQGKVSGDELKGKIEFERDGQTQSREWEAKRSKESKES